MYKFATRNKLLLFICINIYFISLMPFPRQPKTCLSLVSFEIMKKRRKKYKKLAEHFFLPHFAENYSAALVKFQFTLSVLVCVLKQERLNNSSLFSGWELFCC